jgi:hypothetical protein
MAKKKRKPRRKTASLSSGGKRKSVKRRPRSRGILSDMTNPTVLMNGAKFAFSAAVGGIAGTHASKYINPAATKLQRGLIILGVGILGNMLGYPTTTAGAVGAMTAANFPNGLSDGDDSDNANFADQNVLSDMPLFLDDNGRAMVLEEGEDGANYRYLSDREIRTLEDQGAFSDYEIV